MIPLVYFGENEAMGEQSEIELEPEKKPECPPPVWDNRRIEPDACWRATLIACGARG